MKLGKIMLIMAALSLTVASFTGCSSGKDEYPSEDITVIVPYAAGGTTDLCVRGAIEAIPSDAKPSVNITVSNVSGGSGLVGTTQFVNADSDGYTMGIVNCDLVLNNVNGNTEIAYSDFTPIATLMNQPNLVLVNVDAPFDTFEEMIEWAKANPGQLKVGNSGEGTIPKLSAQAIEKALGLEFKYVTYDADSNSVTAVVAGEVDVTCCSAAPAVGQLQAGTIKAIAVTDNQRSVNFPDVPAMGELYEELADTRILTWVYLAVKNDVDEDKVAYLQELFSKAVASDEFKATQDSFSIDPTSFDGTDATIEFWAQQYDFYSDLIG